MTVIEKKKALKKIIDSLPEDKLEEALLLVEDLARQDESRIAFIKDLLERKKALFEKLAQ